jgi:hypothetical protein
VLSRSPAIVYDSSSLNARDETITTMRPPFTPGLYYLHMQDGTTIFAEIGTSSKCESWWIPIPKYAARDTPSDDWSEVIAYNQIHEPPLTPAATTPIHGPPDPTDGAHSAVRLVGHVEAYWRSLTDEQRCNLIALCCHSCGGCDPSCLCWDDS